MITNGSYSPGNRRPIIVFLSDGATEDDWEPALAELKEKPWFQKAIRAAITFGDNPRTDVLAEITGDPNAVLSVDDAMSANYSRLRELLQVPDVLPRDMDIIDFHGVDFE